MDGFQGGWRLTGHRKPFLNSKLNKIESNLVLTLLQIQKRKRERIQNDAKACGNAGTANCHPE